jgi:tetratricopeptide (TPR) repeat protein
VDIPFVRFAFPLLILYLFWYNWVANPWVDAPIIDLNADPNHLTVEAAQELLSQSRKLTEAARYEEAIGPLTKLHKAYPEDHIYLGQLAENYERIEHFKEAADMWEKYMQYAPSPVDACPQIAFDYERQGLAAETFKAHEHCWQVEENSDTLFFYAHALELEGQFQKALGLYLKGLARSPNYPDIVIGTARCQARLGQGAAAKPRIDKMLQQRPDNIDALVAAGLVYEELGDYSTAMKHLKHAQTLAPQNSDVRQVLARVIRSGRSR